VSEQYIILKMFKKQLDLDMNCVGYILFLSTILYNLSLVIKFKKYLELYKTIRMDTKNKFEQHHVP